MLKLLPEAYSRCMSNEKCLNGLLKDLFFEPSRKYISWCMSVRIRILEEWKSRYVVLFLYERKVMYGLWVQVCIVRLYIMALERNYLCRGNVSLWWIIFWNNKYILC